MKKFLLSMAALATMGAMSANETVILDFTKLSELTTSSEVVAPTEQSTGTECTDVTFSKNGVSVVTTNGTNNAPVIWFTTSNATQYRIYKGATMTVSANENISKIVINGGNNNFTPANVTVTPGSFTSLQKVATWTGSATSVAFTVGDKANMQINSIEVTLGEGGGDEPVLGAIYSETFATDQGAFTIDDKVLPEGLTYVWANDSRYSCMKASAYVKGTTYAAESWLISPEYDLAGYTDLSMSFEQALQYFATIESAKEEAKLMIREANGTWEQITGYTYPEELSWSFVATGNISLDKYAGKKIQVAFAYTSTEAKAGTWEVKNFVIAGKKDAGINNITVDENAPVVYYNLQGVQVANPENGIYIRRQGNKATKVLVK